jgi:glycerate kinase
MSRRSLRDSTRRVVIAPDSFKGSIEAVDAAAALATGWTRRRPGDEVICVPLADGGEGTLDALASGLPSHCRRTATVHGPAGEPVEATWLLRPDGTAVVELAQAAGITQLDTLRPLSSTTFGVGELLRLAVTDPATTRVLLALGGSATTDGGAGALTGLGARLLDAAGHELPLGGAALARLASVTLDDLLPGPIAGLECLVDVTNPLLGDNGAAAVYGPQKGATTADTAVLEAALTRYATVLGSAAPRPMDPDTPGAGAAGGTAFGLLSCWAGRLTSGAAAVADAAGLPAHLAEADIVITGEGRFDRQSTHGKVVGHVLDLATERRTPVAIVAGILDMAPPPPAYTAVSLTGLAPTVSAAMREPGRWLAAAADALAVQVSSDEPAF